MAYAILRTQKLKTAGNVGGASAHNTRLMEVPGLADRGHLNRITGAKNASRGVSERIEAIYEGTGKSPRKNAVIGVETLLTASPEFFDELAPNWRDGELGRIEDWYEANIEFMREYWGEDNIIQTALHIDEATPHIHVITVPEREGKLNCRAILGGKQNMQQLQDSYAERMKPFGLQRGVKNSNAHHIPISDYHGAIQNSVENLPEVNNIVTYGGKNGLFRVHTHNQKVILWNNENRDKVLKLVETAKSEQIHKELTKRAEAKLERANSVEVANNKARLAISQLRQAQDEVQRLKGINKDLRERNEDLSKENGNLSLELRLAKMRDKKLER